MAVTPLTNRPVPANSDPARALFAWLATDPLDTDTHQQNLINFCGTNGCDTIFLDVYGYLGGANWTAAKVTRMAQFLDLAHRSGVRVMAVAGNIDWGTNHAWVMKNVVNPIMAFNAEQTSPSKVFDGFCLDIEYWTDPTNYPASTNLPGFCDLVKAIKAKTNLLVGCFAAFYLKDNSATRATITYNGKTAQDGEHMMDACDFVVVGAYRNHAADNGTDGPGQETLAQPWFDYATQSGLNKLLYVGAETTNQSPAYITYFGGSKATMETQLALVSAQFKSTTNSSYSGICVNSYDGWKALT